MSPFALFDLENGREPSARYVNSQADLNTGEVYVEDADFNPEWVWDAATARLREKAPAEILKEKKAAKIQDFARHATDDLSPLFTDHQGKDETLHLAVGHIVRICQALGITPDPRLEQVVTVGQKALDKKAQVEAATTEAELEAMTWT